MSTFVESREGSGLRMKLKIEEKEKLFNVKVERSAEGFHYNDDYFLC